MKRAALALLGSLVFGGSLLVAHAQISNRTTYTLLQGSYLLDGCDICGRPTIEEPLRGTFDLVLLQNTAPYTRYAVENIDFVAGRGSSLERHITGNGTYVRFEEFAILQDMDLSVQIKDDYTNRTAFFTNQTREVRQPFPLIQVDLKQTNGTLIQTFSLLLFAAPVTEIWFSTSQSFISTNGGITNVVRAGDLISNPGRVVKRNEELTSRLGIMPGPPTDFGLDAVDVVRRGEILFSFPADVFSETLGWIHHGDLVSNRGVIVKRNQELLAAFQPVSSADAGLDAVQVLPSGEILFSIQSNVVTASKGTLSRGDILSDQGTIYLRHQQLLTNFHPTVTNYDFGLDALSVLPSGEIWFSVEEGFTDTQLGAVQPGDLLSTLGYRVFSNQDLLAAFSPTETSKDYGLDALFVITDTRAPSPSPRITKQTFSNNVIHLEWDGDGAVFRLETAAGINGPWGTCSPIVSDLFFDSPCDSESQSGAFFRLRQW